MYLDIYSHARNFNLIFTSTPVFVVQSRDRKHLFQKMLKHVFSFLNEVHASFGTQDVLSPTVSDFLHFPLAQLLFVYEIICDPIDSGDFVVPLIFRSVYCNAVKMVGIATLFRSIAMTSEDTTGRSKQENGKRLGAHT